VDYSICCIKGCDRPSVALGLCSKHWRRNKLYGSPVATKHHAAQFRGMSPEQRFWSRVVKRDNGCWEWQGAKDRDGYGMFRGVIRGITYNRAHRFSYALHYEDIPKGKHVCHKCDNPKCVNPEHLWIGSNADNMHDKIAKGRHKVLSGENSPHAKITEEEAKAILTDPRPYSLIASEYNIAASTVGSIKNKNSWQGLDVNAIKAKRISPRRGVSDKLTPKDIIEIRSSTERGKDLAAKYNVSQQTICGIRKGRSWTHVTDKENDNGSR